MACHQKFVQKAVQRDKRRFMTILRNSFMKPPLLSLRNPVTIINSRWCSLIRNSQKVDFRG